MQEVCVIGFAFAEYGEDTVYELGADGVQDKELGFAFIDLALVVGSQPGVVPHGHDGRHVQKALQSSVGLG
jgi:hypothetical protein